MQRHSRDVLYIVFSESQVKVYLSAVGWEGGGHETEGVRVKYIEKAGERRGGGETQYSVLSKLVSGISLRKR